MKILELRFNNLNSLYGEWFIDFTDPEYTSNGIFALTGPTGAGKSTILDAICLALYGATPRLGKITKSSNEIMSRQTGECYAEVVFESQNGIFRCHWGQHRARKKADGDLQAPRHEIAEADAQGKIIESQTRKVSQVIEDKTGMDFDRFTRSILLAQGGFDTFLKADIEQKSKILEQITGTEIYSVISQRVHERQRDERKQLDILQAETKGIVILEPDQEREIEQELEIKQGEEVNLAASTASAAKAIAWLTNLDQLKKEINSLSEESLKLQRHAETFKPQRDKLDRAIKAALLEGSYATLTALRKQQLDDRKAQETGEGKLPKLESAVREQARVLKLAEQQAANAKEGLRIAAPLLQKVRSFDQTLADQKKAIVENEQSCQKETVEIDSNKRARVEELSKYSEAQKDLQLVESYLNEHTQDKWLISGLAGVEELLSSLLSRQNDIVQKEAEHKKAELALEHATSSVEDSTKHCKALSQQLEEALRNLQQGENTLTKLLDGKLLREYRAEKDALLREMTLLAKIAELEDHRAKLEDGKACPLCGSTEHPYAQGNAPVADETEQQIEAITSLIHKAENQEAAIMKLKEAKDVARNNLTQGEKQEAAATNERKAADKELAEFKQSLKKMRSDFAELKQEVSTRLVPLGITEIPETQVSSLLESLTMRLHEWQAQVNKKSDIEKQIAGLSSEIKRLDAVIETQSNALAKHTERLQVLKNEYSSVSNERIALYGDRNPDDEERGLNKALVEAESAEKRDRDLHNELQQTCNSSKSHIDALKQRIEQRGPELKKVETEFSLEYQNVGFSDEKQFLAARLGAEERNELAAKAKELDDRQIDLRARQKDRESRLAMETASKVTDKSLDELQPQFKKYEESLQQLRENITSLRYRLSENSAAKKRIKEKQAAIDAQKSECQRWEKLHGLIGSADGKKFRNFAQGLTFELMVSHANRQLEKMTDRYLLIRDDEIPLELNVIDNYQAGEIRSTRNLSGGESFIVSLTLALGLSKMASRKVRVDSLFLDEGFGTLDEDSLEMALETLSSLHQDGKLIGVISHVPALKERISTQIEVSPTSGGRSRIQGPGCQACKG